MKIPYTRRSSQSNKIPSFKMRSNFLKDSFFPAVISEWDSLDENIQNSSSINVFKKELLKFIWSKPKSTCNIHDTKGLKLITRLRLGLSHLGDHKFRHNFQHWYHQCILAARILKQQLIFSFTAPIIIVQRKLYFTR